MLLTNIKNYIIALANQRMKRFSDEPRECRKILVVLPDRRRVEVDIPIAMLEADREERHARAFVEAGLYCAHRKYRKADST